VYELNEFDRDSPAFLELSRQSVNKIDPDTGAHIKALGDQVPFTNKVPNSNFSKFADMIIYFKLAIKEGLFFPEVFLDSINLDEGEITSPRVLVIIQKWALIWSLWAVWGRFGINLNPVLMKI